MGTPAMQKVRAIDVRPYRWALWCTIGDEPQPRDNPIVYRSWSSDGQAIHFGLESHNGFTVPAEKDLELVPLAPIWAPEDDQAEFLAKRPKSAGDCSACGGTGRIGG